MQREEAGNKAMKVVVELVEELGIITIFLLLNRL